MNLAQAAEPPQDTVGFRRKAASGDARAQSALADGFADGKGIPNDNAEALTFCLLAAKRVHIGAEVRLGLICARGTEATN